eukprot:scaffold205396_cov20-Tisochrysis_lutea.AAC.1
MGEGLVGEGEGRGGVPLLLLWRALRQLIWRGRILGPLLLQLLLLFLWVWFLWRGIKLQVVQGGAVHRRG